MLSSVRNKGIYFSILLISLFFSACINDTNNTTPIELDLISRNSDTSVTPKLLYDTQIQDTSIFEEKIIFFKIYEVQLINGESEKRGIITIEDEVFFIGPLKAYFPSVDAEFIFFKIQRGQYSGVYVGETINEDVELFGFRRERTAEDSTWSIGAGINDRGGILPFYTNDPRNTQWKEINNLDFTFPNRADYLAFDFDPPVDISEFFVDIPYEEPGG